jgi:hypothetical protein
MKAKLSQHVLGSSKVVVAIAACLVVSAGCTNNADTSQSLGRQVSTPVATEIPVTKETIPSQTPTPKITKQAEDEPAITGWKWGLAGIRAKWDTMQSFVKMLALIPVM